MYYHHPHFFTHHIFPFQSKQSEIVELTSNIIAEQNNVSEIDRIEIDAKVEWLKTQFVEVKNAINRRIELVIHFLRILQQSDRLSDRFKQVEAMLNQTPDDAKLAQFKNHWEQIKPAYAELKKDGQHFLMDATKVFDVVNIIIHMTLNNFEI